MGPADPKTKDIMRKENYRSISLIQKDAKILRKVPVNSSYQHIKRIIYHNQVEFIPVMQKLFKIHKLFYEIYHIKGMKDKIT